MLTSDNKLVNQLNLPNDEYLHQEDLLSNNSDFILRYAKMPSFKKRNIYNVFKEIIDSEKGPEIFLNSTVTNFKVNNNCLEEIDAISDDGSKINLKPSLQSPLIKVEQQYL